MFRQKTTDELSDRILVTEKNREDIHKAALSMLRYLLVEVNRIFPTFHHHRIGKCDLYASKLLVDILQTLLSIEGTFFLKFPTFLFHLDLRFHRMSFQFVDISIPGDRHHIHPNYMTNYSYHRECRDDRH